eukprot:CAMPEP_0117450480 /NCGR_PEP_ID=MMETSP0759-20121206/8489_1 /TAXON_ID=63605 /ORGANISM="Percolomonas cosmopolitus, Strain WS" /LENGTH=384 /DNA_ID=CAMNT_0005243001 /DNA_START=100 /DNA_END=1251 /DNA_ORIENTATION=+
MTFFHNTSDDTNKHESTSTSHLHPKEKSLIVQNQHLKLKVHSLGMSIMELQVKEPRKKEEVTVDEKRDENGLLVKKDVIEEITKDFHASTSYSPIIQVHEDVLHNLAENQSFNCIVGRNANRTNKASFTLNHQRYHLDRNWKDHFLHGNIGKVNWGIQAHAQDESKKQVLGALLSEDGDQGFPCQVRFDCCYDIADHQITILMKAHNLDETRSTPISLTHHMYWNLSGNYEDVRHSHMLWINAKYYTPVNDDLIPTGDVIRVNKELDFFTEPKIIGEDMSQKLLNSSLAGYDHNFVLNQRDRDPKTGLVLAAELTHVRTRRFVKIYTTLPGLQFYTGNHLKGQRTKEGRGLMPWAGVCLEPQYFPDSVNHAHFPSTIVHAGRVW